MFQPVQRPLNAPAYDPNQQNYFARNHRPRGLPPPNELFARIEEARTSGKLLLQVLQSTPAAEVLYNDLIKEFAERCQSASRSIQGYIHAENPAPDDDTLLTLIETNEQLSQAMSKHQRALLQARRVTGSTSISPSPPPGPPPASAPRRDENRKPSDDDNQNQQWHPTNLPLPAEPNYYGSMAAPGIVAGPPSSSFHAASPAEQPGVYPQGYRHAQGTLPPQELPTERSVMHGTVPPGEHASESSPAATRQPVTYRY